jgi:RNA polymerase sigma-54 factor
MSPALQIRLTQQLRLTPRLLQSIRLLGLSTVELEQEVEGVVLENPMLERDDDPLAMHLRLAPDGEVLDRAPGRADGTTQAQSEGRGEGDGGGAGDGAGDGAGEGGGAHDSEAPLDGADWARAGTGARGDDDAGEGPRDWAASAPGLEEHLRSQLASTSATARDRALVELLISELDDHGYLIASLEELRGLIEEEEPIEEGELETALRLLQSFDPPGVGARTAAECIRIQLDQRLAGAAAAEREELTLAQEIAAHHIGLLATRDYARLRRVLGVEEALLRAAISRIIALNPFPGSAYGRVSPAYIIPDILVRRVRSRWVAEINPAVRPRVRIHSAFEEFVRREGRKRRSAAGEVAGVAAGAGAAPQSVAGAPATDWKAKALDAYQFLRGLQDRFETIRQVAQAVVDRQSGFFTHGAIAMRPLVRREIAELLELNESTVSRATSNKFMATPFGVFELRYFFASHVATDSGGEASSTAVRELIAQLVAAEDPAAPLSDGQIQQNLVAQGMMVARRTVAKYREQLRIAPGNLRRKL